MIKKTEAREYALQYLYRVNSQETSELVELIRDEQAFNQSLKEHSESVNLIPDSTQLNYAIDIIKGTISNFESLNEEISLHSKNWKLERIASIDRTILLLALYEIHHVKNIPYKVVINEALELAKKYASSESSKYINGILDQARKNN